MSLGFPLGRRQIHLVSCILAFIASGYARADLCDLYKKTAPSLYKIICKSTRAARTARNSSSFSDSFNLNPSGLPNKPTPYGLETIGTRIRGDGGKYGGQFAVVKGFTKIGAGLSSAGNNTFYGNDIIQRYKKKPNIDDFSHGETERGVLPSFNLGTAIGFTGKNSKTPTSLGISVRYNKITNKPGGGLGFSIKPGFMTFGIGAAYEDISNELDPVRFYSGVVGMRFPFCELEYNILWNAGGYSLPAIHIGTLTLLTGALMPSYAVRKAYYYDGGQVLQHHWSVQYQFSKTFAGGILYNYLPGTTSLATQIFL